MILPSTMSSKLTSSLLSSFLLLALLLAMIQVINAGRQVPSETNDTGVKQGAWFFKKKGFIIPGFELSPPYFSGGGGVDSTAAPPDSGDSGIAPSAFIPVRGPGHIVAGVHP